MLSINFALVIWDFCFESWTTQIPILSISISPDLSLTSDTTQRRHFFDTFLVSIRNIPSNQRTKESTDWTYVYPKKWCFFSCQNLTCKKPGDLPGRKPFKIIFCEKLVKQITSERCRLQFSKNSPPISKAFFFGLCVKDHLRGGCQKTPTKSGRCCDSLNWGSPWFRGSRSKTDWFVRKILPGILWILCLEGKAEMNFRKDSSRIYPKMIRRQNSCRGNGKHVVPDCWTREQSEVPTFLHGRLNSPWSFHSLSTALGIVA